MVQALKRTLLFVVGVMLAMALILGADMKAGGVVAAKHIHHGFPECSGPCHG